jgi:hypothetical protein
MKGTQSQHVHASPAEGDKFADDLFDTGGGEDVIDNFALDHGSGFLKAKL